ncbi:ATP-binding protein, partial [Frankia sp. CNm7]|uniref:AAA family ATPase n=1 Tax=Frankia nepalensis TaxID=1836974 RepID=UPI001933171A
MTSLVGREDDLATLTRLMAEARVVSLVGPGGVGKTRLSLHLADRLAARFTAGVRVVELAPVPAGAPIAAMVADALGVARSAGAAPGPQARAPPQGRGRG